MRWLSAAAAMRHGWFLLPGVLACAGCIEANLGDTPFYCNNGIPQCPEGYVCQQQGKVHVCVRSGASLPDTRPSPEDAVVPDTATLSDQPPPPPPKADRYIWPDQPVTKQDKGPVGDAKPLPKDRGPWPDGVPPHFGCQSYADCPGTDAPCCCPTPFIPQVWSCLPLCLGPFCL